MGMSTHIVGFRPPDEKWKAMKAIWDACRKADVSVPREVDDFFNGEVPDPAGVEVPLKEAVRDWGDESRDGFEVDVTKLPKDVTIIRFYNSW